MKKILPFVLGGSLMIGAAGCKKYLEIVPKGEKVPQTLADYKPLMESKAVHTFDYTNQILVANEFYTPLQQQVSINLTNINFNWQEDKSRAELIVDDAAYNGAYAGIFIYNTLVNKVPDATTGSAAEKAQLVAQARIGRSMLYFYLITSYAKMYDAATAGTDPGVPFNISGDTEDQPKQLSVQQIYDFILKDVNAALPDLPKVAENGYYASKGAGYAFLSRVHLFMKNYSEAASFADLALAENSALFDYIGYYNDNKTIFDKPVTSVTVPKFEFTSPENYIFHYGGSIVQNQGFYASSVRYADSAQFDNGDVRRIVNLAPRSLGANGETIWAYRRTDNVNVGGIRTPEMYYVKAECLARNGKLAEAMAALNTVRRKRILPAVYTDVTAGTAEEAIRLIRRDLLCEYRGTGLPYLTYRRFNNDPQYKATITKMEGTNTYSIKPESLMWIMPFSVKALAYNKSLQQNSK
ncbi:RagB/SusD family nutrient uptake outer membrane protein [Chitinophaga varians]|uniref:RagB/SusD family nutrient uptake outer membrane protein n=1 Tax=Chitinophaga varians TaxID=2202339 RepID=A0A847RUB1_9BACT|nr:RagB/SusD family nutrient uptake outer membrane protein [Chitinophaga varians]NLR65454.1 RagB/SusD family nutrient uptake outer membrane protein [Chitinophaga varians]